MVHHDIVNVC